jgi:hypothetical protein
MSADNGVFVLQTKGPEFRIAYAHAIDNIYGKFNDDTANWDGDMEAMVEYFGKSKVYTSIEEALDEAERISYDYEYLEYGVCLITTFRNLQFGVYSR